MCHNEFNAWYRLLLLKDEERIYSDHLYGIYECKRIALIYMKRNPDWRMFRIDSTYNSQIEYELVNKKYIRIMPNYRKIAIDKIKNEIGNGYICINEVDNPMEFGIIKELVSTFLKA